MVLWQYSPLQPGRSIFLVLHQVEAQMFLQRTNEAFIAFQQFQCGPPCVDIDRSCALRSVIRNRTVRVLPALALRPDRASWCRLHYCNGFFNVILIYPYALSCRLTVRDRDHSVQQCAEAFPPSRARPHDGDPRSDRSLRGLSLSPFFASSIRFTHTTTCP